MTTVNPAEQNPVEAMHAIGSAYREIEERHVRLMARRSEVGPFRRLVIGGMMWWDGVQAQQLDADFEVMDAAERRTGEHSVIPPTA